MVQIILHIKAIVTSIQLNVKALDYMELNLQVILCQKHSFLHQLTQNMTTNCLLNYQLSTWFVQNLYWACSFLVMNSYFKEQFFVIFWVNWSKNECFWQKIICTVQCNHVCPCRKECEDIIANYSYSYDVLLLKEKLLLKLLCKTF